MSVFEFPLTAVVGEWTPTLQHGALHAVISHSWALGTHVPPCTLQSLHAHRILHVVLPFTCARLGLLHALHRRCQWPGR